MRRLICFAACLLAANTHAADNESVADQESFDVWEYRVLGNTVLSRTDIETAVYPKLGPKRSLADVEEVRTTLEKLYRDRGYGAVFVDIPEQEVNSGIVRLKVTEGRLSRVRITGARYFSNGRIREALPALARGEVLELPEFQQQLNALNRQSADRQVTPVLRPGRTPGTVDVDLKVQDELPMHGGVEINDRYTANTSRTRASVNLSFDNLFQRFHRLSLQYQTTPEEPEETRVLAATYIAPLAPGNLLAVYAVDTKSDFASVGTIGPLSVLGSGRIYGARFITVLPDASGYSHSVSFGGDYKDFADSILQPDGPADRTPIEYMHWTAQYSGTFRTEQTLTAFNIGPNFGIRGLGNSSEEFAYKRFKAEANYFYLSADVQHERPLLWGARAFMRAAGQYTTDPLISNEQFSAGGADSVRGYLESEEMGDNGAYGSLELRFPQIGRWLPDPTQQAAYIFAFYDAGVLGILEPLAFEGEKVSRRHIRSWGTGVRWSGFGLEADLDWAYPLRDTDNVESGDSRVHFRLRYDF